MNLQVTDFYKACVALGDPEECLVLINPVDFEDVKQWDENITGKEFAALAQEASNGKSIAYGYFVFNVTDHMLIGKIALVAGTKSYFILKNPD